MRLLIDYRPALRDRTGVGEWVHELVRTLGELRDAEDSLATGLEITLFSSSLRDRLEPAALSELGRVRPIDRRIPVRMLNRAWYRHGWPPVEWLAPGPFDVVQATAPALIPSRRGLRVVTIYDLDFLHHPERAWGEMRSDFPSLVREHAGRADLVVTISDTSAQSIVRKLGVSPDRLVVCRPGLPRWIPSGASAPAAVPATEGYILAVGTLEPRKNIGGLLDAYEQLLTRMPDAPHLVLVGRPTEAAGFWLARAASAPLRGKVEVRGYIPSSERVATYRGAALLVLPSFDEGFGLPALEAMAMRVPVVASTRGALPEVIGQAGLLVDPEDSAAIAAAMHRVLADGNLQRVLRDAGTIRARQFSWRESAKTLLERYSDAIARGRGRPSREVPGP